ncbi:MAG TPA: DUF4926 domain-containing protein [Blastocatellia bacterium]
MSQFGASVGAVRERGGFLGGEDVPGKGLLRGRVGTVVEDLAPGVYEVEFSDDSGETYASVALRSDRLIRLHHQPSHQAA